MVRSYIHDNDNTTDFRAPHDSGEEVSLDQLSQIGALYFHITSPDQVDQLAKERDYKNQDVVNISLDGFGNDEGKLLDKLNVFYEEHLHEDEEIRYCVEGSGYFDLRDARSDKWIRCHVTPGDLLIVPAGIYHRFTLTLDNKIVAKRLFKEEPRWEAHNKSVNVDSSSVRKEYLESLSS